ncbi:MAG: amidohydrolase family protein [Bacteriovoracaceae bacterium]
MKRFKLIYSNFINPYSDTRADFISGSLLLKLDKKKRYRVVGIYPKGEWPKYNKSETEIYHYENRLILPAFFDMHFHWVQDDVRYAPKKHLLTWLENYVFPHEAKFSNHHFSEKKAKQFFKKLYKSGTIGGAIYGSIHENSVTDALKYAHGEFIAGNVIMTMHSPQALLQTRSQALKLIKKLSRKLKKKYAFTPRFALTVDSATMKKGGAIARQNKSYIQTHLSENRFEIETILKIFRNYPEFKKVKSYTEIYEKCKLLTSDSFFAHAIHLSQAEWKMLAKYKAKIIHCPTSNAPLKEFGLGSGLFNFEKCEQFSVDWAQALILGEGWNSPC